MAAPRPLLPVDALAITDETWWRHARMGFDFMSVPTPAADGRWQRGMVVPAIYLAESEATAWAEHYRALAERGLPPLEGFPRDLWRCEVTLERVADLSSVDRLEAVGLSVPQPQRAEWPRFQAVGERLFGEGWHGVLAPSAARPDVGRSLAVFQRDGVFAGLRPRRPPRHVPTPPPIPRGLRA